MLEIVSSLILPNMGNYTNPPPKDTNWMRDYLIHEVSKTKDKDIALNNVKKLLCKNANCYQRRVAGGLCKYHLSLHSQNNNQNNCCSILSTAGII